MEADFARDSFSVHSVAYPPCAVITPRWLTLRVSTGGLVAASRPTRR
jgi:hypothetical protein